MYYKFHQFAYLIPLPKTYQTRFPQICYPAAPVPAHNAYRNECIRLVTTTKNTAHELEHPATTILYIFYNITNACNMCRITFAPAALTTTISFRTHTGLTATLVCVFRCPPRVFTAKIYE